MLWIQISSIRIHLTVLDPDPMWNTDPDPGAWKLTKITNKPGFLPFKNAFVSLKVIFRPVMVPTLVYFSCKNLNFCVVQLLRSSFFIKRGCLSKIEIGEREIYMHFKCM